MPGGFEGHTVSNMKGKRRREQELEPDWDDCQCQLSSLVKHFLTKRLPILFLLALSVGAVCGFSRLDTVSTTWTAFVVGFCTVAMLRRWSGTEVVNTRFGTGRRGFIPVLDSKLEQNLFDLFNDFDGRTRSPAWTSPEARIEWEKNAQAYAMQLGGIAAEAREVAARLNAAARQAHAYAGNIVSVGVPQTNDDSSIRIVRTGDSALTDGMSTRSNALFEDFGPNTEDPCRTVLTAEAVSVVPECGLIVTYGQPRNRCPQTSGELQGISVQTSDSVAVVTGGGTIEATKPSLESRPTKYYNDSKVVSGNSQCQSTECSTVAEEIVEIQVQRRVSGDQGSGYDLSMQRGVREAVTVPDSVLQKGEGAVQGEDGWCGGDDVSADMFEPIPSEEASFRTGQVQNTSLSSGLPESEGALCQVSAERKRSVNLEDWAEVEFASMIGHEDEASPRTVDGAADHVSRVESGMSYKTTRTDISLLAAADADSATTSPEVDLGRRTASFRDTGTKHQSASTEYAKTSGHRVSKSDGDFLFRNSTDGSASERENSLSLAGSPTGYDSATVRDMKPRNGAAEITGRNTMRSQGIASRLRGALTPRRFASSRVVPRRDDIHKPDTGSRKDGSSKSLAPKREDVLKVNRIPSTEAAAKVETDSRVLSNPVRRRLLS